MITLPITFNEHFVTCFVFTIRHLQMPLSFFFKCLMINLWFPKMSFSNRYLFGWSVGSSSSPLNHFIGALQSFTSHSRTFDRKPINSRPCLGKFFVNLYFGSDSVRIWNMIHCLVNKTFQNFWLLLYKLPGAEACKCDVTLDKYYNP